VAMCGASRDATQPAICPSLCYVALLSILAISAANPILDPWGSFRALLKFNVGVSFTAPT
jgi:hypothetical protein